MRERDAVRARRDILAVRTAKSVRADVLRRDAALAADDHRRRLAAAESSVQVALVDWEQAISGRSFDPEYSRVVASAAQRRLHECEAARIDFDLANGALRSAQAQYARSNADREAGREMLQDALRRRARELEHRAAMISDDAMIARWRAR